MQEPSRPIRGRIWSLVTVLVLALAAPACGGSAKEVEEPEPQIDNEAEGKKALEQAVEAEELGQPSLAGDHYERALAMRPEHYGTVERYTRFLLMQRRSDKAIEISRRYLDGALGNLQAYHLHADALIAAGKLDAAYETLSQLLELDESDAAAYVKRGKVQIAREKLDEGFADLDKALALAPESADFRTARAEALSDTGKLGEAAKELRSILETSPDHVQAHIVLGVVMRGQGERDKALALHKKAAELAPRSGKAHFELGVSQNYVGDNQGAEQSLKRATELEPAVALNWYAYGELLRALQRFPEAVEMYRKALTIEPDHAKASNKLAIVLLHLGDLKEAEAVLTAHVRQHPEEATLYFTLGEVYAKQEAHEQALAAYEKFLELASPKDPDVAKARQQIRWLKRKSN